MKRYGDNLPSPSTSEAETNDEQSMGTMVMYGGCGVNFGTFARPAERSNKERKLSSLLALLGFKRNKTKKAGG